MKYGGLEHVSWQQYRVAMHDLTVSGDDEVLEDLGYIRSPETLARHVACGAEVARVLGIDMRTPAEKARDEAHAYYAQEFSQTGVPDLDDRQRETLAAGLALARAALEQRHDTPS